MGNQADRARPAIRKGRERAADPTAKRAPRDRAGAWERARSGREGEDRRELDGHVDARRQRPRQPPVSIRNVQKTAYRNQGKALHATPRDGGGLPGRHRADARSPAMAGRSRVGSGREAGGFGRGRGAVSNGGEHHSEPLPRAAPVEARAALRRLVARAVVPARLGGRLRAGVDVRRPAAVQDRGAQQSHHLVADGDQRRGCRRADRLVDLVRNGPFQERRGVRADRAGGRRAEGGLPPLAGIRQARAARAPPAI